MKIYALLLALCLCVTPAYAQTLFPQRGVEIIDVLYRGVSAQDDGARRIRIKITCEQFTHDLGVRWGGKKRAGLTDDSRSPDSIAYLEDNGTVTVWDIQLSSGAIDVAAGKPANHPNLPTSEATFMPCDSRDHIGSGAVVIPPPVDVPPDPIVVVPSLDVDRIVAAIVFDGQQTRQELRDMRKSLEEHRAEVRKGRSAVLDFLGNWRNYVKIGLAGLGTWGTIKATDDQ